MDSERRGDLGDIVRNLSSSSSSSSKAFESLPVPEAKDFPPPLQFTDSLTNILSYPLLPESLGPVSGDGLYSGHNNLHKAALVEEMYQTCPCDILSTTVHQISPSPTTSQQGVLPETPPLLLADAAMELNYHVLPDATAIAQIPSPTSQAIKRRKSQAKKVMCIPAPANAGCRQSGEVVPSDLWAWRKYGQKPIKGSPYPRGYYRCSSSKGCSARKQVERSRTDPNMLVITYTSEHNHPWPTHRNALAGSTRSQPTKVPSSSSRIATASIDIQRAEHVDQSVKAEEATSTGGNVTERVQFHHHQPAVNFDDQLFADLGELGPQPVDQMVLSKDLLGDRLEEEMSDKALDPFGLLDWGGDSTAANSSHSSMARKG